MEGKINPVFDDQEDFEPIHGSRSDGEKIESPRVEIDTPLDTGDSISHEDDEDGYGDDVSADDSSSHLQVIWRIHSQSSAEDEDAECSTLASEDLPGEETLETRENYVYNGLLSPSPPRGARGGGVARSVSITEPPATACDGHLKSCMRPKDALHTAHYEQTVHIDGRVAPPVRYSVVSQPESLAGVQSKSIWSSGTKRRTLSMMLSFTYFLIIVIVSAALQLTHALGSGEFDTALYIFYCLVYCSATIVLVVLFALAAKGKLTRDDHYKHRRKSAFMRGGIIVLGTGEVLYRSLLFMRYLASSPGCRHHTDLMLALPGLFSAILEIAFLFVFTRIRLNKNHLIAIVGHFLIMHLVANNMSVWLAVVVTESLEEIVHSYDHYLYIDAFYDLQVQSNTTGTAGLMSTMQDVIPDCSDNSDILTTVSPYLFPLIIEFCIMVSTMWLSIWENCGAGLYREQFKPRKRKLTTQISHLVPASSDSPYGLSVRRRSGDSVAHARRDYTRERSKSTVSMVSIQHTSGYRNSNVGFIFGWLVVLMGVVMTLVFLYDIIEGNSLSNNDQIWFAYGSNMVISLLCIPTIPVISARMSTMGTLDQESDDEEEETVDKFAESTSFVHDHSIDKRLMLITYMALLVFKLLSILAALHEGNTIIIADGIVSIILGALQTGFINNYAFTKVSISDRQRRHKPGRHGLEFLRCCQLALWLINSFILKNSAAKSYQYDAFGTTAWAIISNVFQPLTILHYFHCMICIAEVVNHAYSEKYVNKETHALQAIDLGIY